MAKEEQVMSTASAGAEQAILNMLQRYEVLMMEDLICIGGRPDFSRAQLFLAIARLSRKNLIALRRVGLSYQIRPINQAWTLSQGKQHEEPAAHH
jgi:predicted transcriptional regulator